VSQIFLEVGRDRPVQVDFERQLNSVAAIAQPIYQHARGPRTVRPRVQNSKAF
jgi:hypothetical protein